jgi:hypothetical protein
MTTSHCDNDPTFATVAVRAAFSIVEDLRRNVSWAFGAAEKRSSNDNGTWHLLHSSCFKTNLDVHDSIVNDVVAIGVGRWDEVEQPARASGES